MDKTLIENIVRIIIAINYGIAVGIICSVINITLGFGAAAFMSFILTLGFIAILWGE